MDEKIDLVISRLHELMREMKILMAQSELVRSEAAELRKWTREIIERSQNGHLDFGAYLDRLKSGPRLRPTESSDSYRDQDTTD
jgi:hypothetical protein